MAKGDDELCRPSVCLVLFGPLEFVRMEYEVLWVALPLLPPGLLLGCSLIKFAILMEFIGVAKFST